MHRLKSSRWRLGIGFGLGLLLFVGLSSQFRSDAKLPTLSPLPQDPYIQAYFNQSQAAVYTDPYRKITRYGDDLEQVIIDAIHSAQTSVDVAVHEFTLPRIAQALSERQAQGVRVRVVVENSYSTPMAQRQGNDFSFLDDHERNKATELYQFVDLNQDGILSADEIAQRDALSILDQAQVPRIDDTADGSKGSGLMHHKFMVIDGRRVVTGSANWTMSDIHGDLGTEESRGNANAVLVIDSSSLAQTFAAEFALMWGDGPGKTDDSQFGLQKPARSAQRAAVPGSTVEVQFSPISPTQPWATSVNGLIAKTLGQATQQVNLALFVFSEQAISNHLWTVAQRGVPIRTLIDPGFAYRSYSEGLDMMGLSLPDHRCKMDGENRPWPTPITSVGIPTLAEGDKLHHKFAVLDSLTVIMGSQNWSHAANTTNDENLLVIRNPTVAAHFQREFDRLYGTAQLGLTPQLQRAIDKQRSQCGL
ncbi:phospholipase D-like domain-containing protein [Phormidium sp. FACHB-1136]|uniref:phospholipase D-like domain-containing protein n=1 Tax=Phormidium sp. FACHB-1136 TaxID=2692848 RepID=UPI001685EBEF|nr:competence protein ComE [Phormidium sp. FACHB-1136]